MSELEEFLKEATASVEPPKEDAPAVEAAQEEQTETPPQEAEVTKTEEAPAEEVATTGEEALSPGAESSEKPPHVAALVAERKRRQEAEEKASKLEKELAAFGGRLEQMERSAKPKEETPEAPSFLDDPEAAQTALVQGFESKFEKLRINNSVAVARVQHPDFDRVVNGFMDLASKDQTLGLLVEPLYTAASKKDNPGLEFYNAVKRFLPAEVPPVTPEEVKAKVVADLAAAKTPPASLAEERNVGTRTGPEWSGPPQDTELNVGKGLA